MSVTRSSQAWPSPGSDLSERQRRPASATPTSSLPPARGRGAGGGFSEQGNMPDVRLDRQLRIPGWDQQTLEEARIAVFGDDDLLASLYVLSAAALGLNTIVLIAPRWDEALLDTARRVNPRLRLSVVDGYYTHPALDDIFWPCTAIVDLTHYALANKLLLEKGFRSGVPVIRGFCHQQDGEEGLKVFADRRGREWQGAP